MTVAQTWWALWLPSAATAGPRVSQTDSQTHRVGVWVRAKGGRAVSKCQGVFMDERWGEGVGRMTWHPRCRSRGRHFFMSRLVWIQRNHIQIFVFVKFFPLWRYLPPPSHSWWERQKQRERVQWPVDHACVGRRPTPTAYVTRLKKKKAIKDESRITKEIQFTATQGCQ